MTPNKRSFQMFNNMKIGTKLQQNANIASITNDIAKETDSIADQVVENVNEKQFVGKENVKPKQTTVIETKDNE